MKLKRFLRECVCDLTAVSLGGALLLLSGSVNGQERGAERLIQGAERPEPGPNPPENLQPQFRGPEREPALENPERNRQRARLQQEVMEEMKARLNDLVAAGKEEEAAELKEQIARREREAERFQRERRDPRPEAAPQRGPRMERLERFEREPMSRRGPGSPGEMPELHQRLHHLQAAIDNLHAAGMHEPAERLAQQAGRMRQQLQATPPARRSDSQRRAPGPRAGRPAEDAQLEPMREEIRRLNEALQDLRRRVDELSRERR